MMEQTKPVLPQDIPQEQIPGQQEADIKKLMKEAIELLYDDQLENITKMLGNALPEQLPQKISLVINQTLKRLDKTNGGLPLETAATVGSQLLQHIIEDFVADGIIEEVTAQQMMEAISLTISDYAKANGIPQEQVDELVNAMKAQDQGQPQPPQGQPPQGQLQPQSSQGQPPQGQSQPQPLLGAV